MLTALGTRRARLLAATVVIATLTTGCFAAASTSVGRQVGLPASGATRQLYDLVNQSRAQHGLPRLAWNNQLGGLAADWSDHMAATGRFAHRDLRATMATAEYSSFSRLGENILVGSCGTRAQDMQNAFMNSPSHRANILSSGFNVVGIGVTCSGDGRVWVTQNFGRR